MAKSQKLKKRKYICKCAFEYHTSAAVVFCPSCKRPYAGAVPKDNVVVISGKKAKVA